MNNGPNGGRDWGRGVGDGEVRDLWWWGYWKGAFVGREIW